MLNTMIVADSTLLIDSIVIAFISQADVAMLAKRTVRAIDTVTCLTYFSYGS